MAEQMSVWIVTREGEYWTAATTREIAKSFISNAWLGEWVDEENMSSMQTRHGKFTVFETLVVGPVELGIDSEARKKLGVRPS